MNTGTDAEHYSRDHKLVAHFIPAGTFPGRQSRGQDS